MMVDTLKVFVTVAEMSNFSRAAEMLCISQPGVSQTIRNLENEFDVKLMHRSSKHVKLTEAGEILYSKAKQILEMYDAAKEEIHLLRNEITGSLKIGASFTIGEYILPRLLAEFIDEYPQIEIQTVIGNTEEIERGIRLNELDIGLVEGEVNHPDLLVNPPFMEDEMVLVAPLDHPLCSRNAIRPEMLQDQCWVFRENGSGTRAFTDRFIQDSKLRVRRSLVFNSSQGVKEAVAAGLGMTLLSRWVIRKELEAGELCCIPMKGKRFARDFFILQDTRSIKGTMALKMFMQKLRQFKI